MAEIPIRIGVIGGSGLYSMEGLSDVEERRISTPFGDPSDVIVIGSLEGVRVAFLARHGRGHRIMPTEVNYRANIYALKTLGVEQVISISACGSLREHIHPGEIVIPDQLFDFTKKRTYTFFGNGLVAHIGVADPFCARLSAILADAVEAAAKAVERPTPVKLEQIVRTMIKERLDDGQLSECNLTMGEVERIIMAFTRVLCGMYHERPEYPTLVKGEGA